MQLLPTSPSLPSLPNLFASPLESSHYTVLDLIKILDSFSHVH